jgi:hypothetical protein
MQWIERRDGDWLTDDDGKIVGRVTQGIGSTVCHAESIYAGGGSHKQPLGDYISNDAARRAVEKHAREWLAPKDSSA